MPHNSTTAALALSNQQKNVESFLGHTVGTDLRFHSPQPDTCLCCEITVGATVTCGVCMFMPQIVDRSTWVRTTCQRLLLDSTVTGDGTRNNSVTSLMPKH